MGQFYFGNASAQKHEQGRYEVEYRIIRADGSLRWIYDRGFPVPDDRGRLTSAREEERKRIAREIHDELGQVLTVHERLAVTGRPGEGTTVATSLPR